MVPSSSVALTLEISAQELLALGDLGQESGLDLGCVVDTRPGRGTSPDRPGIAPRLRGGVFKQADQFLGLLGGQRQGGNPECGTLSGMLAVSFKHRLNRVQFENHGSVCPTMTLIKGRNYDFQTGRGLGGC